MTCMVGGRSFGDTLRSCRLLQEKRHFRQCTDDLSALITALEEQAESLPRAKIVSQNELLSLAYNERGGVLYRMVEFSEAVDDFSRALSLNPRMAGAYHNRALIHYRMGRFDEAIADLNKAIELNGFYEDAKRSLRVVQAEWEAVQAKERKEEGELRGTTGTRMKDKDTVTDLNNCTDCDQDQTPLSACCDGAIGNDLRKAETFTKRDDCDKSKSGSKSENLTTGLDPPDSCFCDVSGWG